MVRAFILPALVAVAFATTPVAPSTYNMNTSADTICDVNTCGSRVLPTGVTCTELSVCSSSREASADGASARQTVLRQLRINAATALASCTTTACCMDVWSRIQCEGYHMTRCPCGSALPAINCASAYDCKSSSKKNLLGLLGLLGLIPLLSCCLLLPLCLLPLCRKKKTPAPVLVPTYGPAPMPMMTCMPEPVCMPTACVPEPVCAMPATVDCGVPVGVADAGCYGGAGTFGGGFGAPVVY